jgi:DNA-binding transcriptional ArsR family regulator
VASVTVLVIDMPKRNEPDIELLADPVRRQIIAALALGPRRPSSLATQIGLSRPATKRHLSLLRDAGLVRTLPSYLDRRAVLYAIDPSSRGPITAWLASTEVGRPIVRRDA